MSTIISFISDAIIPIILAIVGIVMLFSPYDKIQSTFPKLKSKKAVKIAGVFFLLCGLGSLILLLTLL